MSTGIITTIAGTGMYLYNGEGIPATAAQFKSYGISFDLSGNLFIADLGNQRIRMIDTFGNIHTIVGNGVGALIGDGGPASAAQVYNPQGVSFDTCGNLYIADESNDRIRKVIYNLGCSLFDSASLNVNSISLNGEKIYPNPAYNSITITATNKINQIIITNLIGQTFFNQAYDIEKKAEINIASLPEGVYIVNVKYIEGESTVTKIIKE